MEQVNFLNRRGSPRYGCGLRASILTEQGEFEVRLIDISAQGAGLEVTPSVALLFGSATWHLRVDGLFEVPCKRIWQKTHRVGLKFPVSSRRVEGLQSQLSILASTTDKVWLTKD